METKVARIPTVDPFKKTWSEATTIISEDDLVRAESDASVNSTRTEPDKIQKQREMLVKEKDFEVVKRRTPTMPDIVIRNDSGLQGQGQGQSPCRKQQNLFKSPKNTHSCDFTARLQPIHSDEHSISVLGDHSDWMLAERSNSRSPPSPAILTRSPDIRSKSPLISHVSPSLRHVTSPSVFSFSPERTELYKNEMETESARVKKRLFGDMTYGHESPLLREDLNHTYHNGLKSPMTPRREFIHHTRHFLSRDTTTREELLPEVQCYFESPSSRSSPQCCREEERFQAKRRLDLDEELVSTPKRLKTEIERETGYRYLRHLEADISSLSEKLYTSKPEVKSGDCTCSIMEKQFLAMAESAYRSVRRLDASPRGFEQFRRELIQTNQVMKDSIDVLKNIRSFCEHKC